MTEIPMPTSAKLVQRSFALDDVKQVNRSEWTKTRKVTGLPGAQIWFAKVAPHQIFEESQQKEWRAFKIRLRGQGNTFRLPIASNQHGGANPTVAAGANAGSSLPLTGLAVSALILEIGDYMTVPLPSGHHRLVMLEADLVSDIAGTATAQFWPPLNQVPAIGITVETVNPFGLMALTDSKQGWQEEYGVMTIEFEAEEAL